MKNIYTVIILLFTSYLCAQDAKTFDLVISKLKNDKRTFEQFVKLGEIYCDDMHGLKNGDLFTEKYLELFNSLYPFPRLIEKNMLEKQYEILQKKIKKDKCSCFYSIGNKKLKEIYIKIIQDKMSYHDNEEYYLEEDMKDYLKDYMIDANRFK